VGNFSILNTDTGAARLAFQDHLRQLMRCFDVMTRFTQATAAEPALPGRWRCPLGGGAEGASGGVRFAP
jgi:hypothetical protein